MAEFLLWPDKRLRTPAAPVEAVDDEVRKIWERMLSAMYAMPGVGLAAPQLGIMRRIAVVDCANGMPIRMANPELLEASPETQEFGEGSPNLPGVTADVARPARVLVSYLDETGTRTRRWFEDLWSASVQHQMDHLDGQLYIERLSRTKRRMLLDRYAKLRKRG